MCAAVCLSVLQGYHELYQRHRSRLETQLLHVMKERDCWIQLAFSLAKKVFDLLFKGCLFVLVFNECFYVTF